MAEPINELDQKLLQIKDKYEIKAKEILPA
jgi:uncharacterized protein YxjI